MFVIVVGTIIAVGFVGLYVWSARTEPRRWRNGVYLLLAMWVLFTLAALWTASYVSESWVEDLLVMALPWLGALLLGFLLIGNGAVMVRRETRTLGNLLSLATGIAIVGAVILGVALVVLGEHPWSLIGVIVLLLPAYPGFTALSYLIYCVEYGARRPRRDPAAIVVLGSGLVDGKVPRLLADRLDEAQRWQQRLRHSDASVPPLIPSGGQGSDEPLPEGEAMAAYLIDHGVRPDDIVVEDRARDSRENLLFSTELAPATQTGQPLLVVTSNYHVGRAALISRRLGLAADVKGARTAWYYLPSAFLREWVAVLTYHRRTNVLAGIAWLVAIAGLSVLTGID